MAGASDPRFADVERQYYALKEQLSGGKLTREQFEAALQKLMILDAQTRYWMMGAETGKWYMYDGQNWQQGDPPSSAAPAAPVAAASVAATQSDSATLASFTPPADAAAAPVTADAAPTMSFTPPAESTAPVTPDVAPTMTFTPPAQKGGEARPDSALTMASFTPPVANKVQLDKAATVAAFAPPKIAAAGTTPPVRAVPAAAAGRKLSPVLLLGCLFALVCLGGIVALAFAVNSRFGNAPNLATPVVAVTATTTATTVAAATDSPTPPSTSVPAATATSAPASTPLPLPTTTPTAQPQASPPLVSPATATPSQTPVPPTPTAQPTATNTPAPARPPRPVVEFPVSISYIGYEKWGRPSNNCTQFNNKDAVRQFKWEELVTNRTTTTIVDADWGTPAVTNNEGTQALVCPYGTPDIPSGQAAKVTYAAYVALNQYVQRIQHQIRNTTYVRCLDASALEVTC